jgi:hypothetical protein
MLLLRIDDTVTINVNNRLIMTNALSDYVYEL